MEERTLRFYLSLFSFFIFFLIYFFYLLYFNKINLDNEIFFINKGEPLYKISNKLVNNHNIFEKNFYYLFISLSNKYYSQVNFGKFKIQKKLNIIQIFNIISSKSNIDYKIRIVEGWEKYQLDKILSNYYQNYQTIPYESLLADTYIINSSNSFADLKSFLLLNKKIFVEKYTDNEIVKKYGIHNLFVIASLIEKEALNLEDKYLVASVIFNRLNLNMKLQIDASVIYAITEGKYKFKRNLTYNDLKIIHPSNTYIYKGIPQNMISYVDSNTIKILMENPKSDFLFYFYNVIENKHIYSKNFNEHKRKLNEYRQKK